MTTTVFKSVTNNAVSTLPSSLSNSATSFSVNGGDGALFPSTGAFWVTVEDVSGGMNREVILISSRSGDTFTVGGRSDQPLSGQTKGTGIAHASGSQVRLLWTAQHAQDLHTSVNNLEKIITYDANGNVGLQITPTYGFHSFGGAARVQALSNPIIPSVSNQGTAGTTSYSYYVVAIDRAGYMTLASPTITTNTGNATLNGTNFNRISWSAVTGAVAYHVIRLAGGATQGRITGSTGTTSTSLDDTGLAATTFSSPPRNTTADLTVDGQLVVGGGDVQISGSTNPYVQVFDGTYIGLFQMVSNALVVTMNGHNALMVDNSGAVTFPTLGDTGTGSVVHGHAPTLDNITLNGTTTVAGNLLLTMSTAGIELGNPGASNTPYIDFHSSGNVIDYDVRLIASGGSTGAGLGILNIIAQNLQVNGYSVWTTQNLASPSVPSLGTTLVQRDSNGYAYATYFSSPANVVTGAPQYVAGQNGDNFFRWYYTDYVHVAAGGNLVLSAQNAFFLLNAGSYVYLPAPTAGKRITVKNVTGAVATAYANGGSIYSTTWVSSITLNNGDCYTFLSDGSNWYIV